MGAHTATDATFDEILATGVDRLVVYFWAPWCAPCKQIAPVIDGMVDAEPRATFVKVNADENPRIVQRYGIMKMPAILYFQGGELTAELRTGVTTSVLRRRVLQWLES